ncbi:MAG: helix-turn-helix domain-containing protein [Herbiconiux sp.]|nr:helix-turn-helix domain-containing protein [Herbiconiux sp.]
MIVPRRVCAYLNRYADLDRFRLQTRGQDAEVDGVLVAFRVAALSWQEAATGTKEAAPPELEGSSDNWMSTTQAATQLGIGDRAVRKAIAEGRLHAENIAGRWRIRRDQLQHFRRTA